MQALSCTSAVVLVAICGLLLRSHALVSGARSPNFDSSDPDIESSSVSSELFPIIVLLIALLTVPTITAIILAIRSNSKFKKLAEEAKQKALELKAHAKITKRRVTHAFLGKEDASFSREQRRISQSSAAPREVAIQLSPDASSSLHTSTFQSVSSAAHAASPVLGHPLNAISLHSSNPAAQNDSSTQGESVEFETEFHFCDFEAPATTDATYDRRSLGNGS
jgi:hypothetical protein